MNLKRVFVYLSCFLCLATFCIGQTAVLMPQPKIQFLNQNGVPLAGGCVNTYAAGTTTNQATFKDGIGSVVNANPVILDSAGRASIFLSRGVLYKFVVTSFGGSNCSTGTLQYTQDNVALGSNLTIGGANTQVQYNSNGTFAGSPNFTWNNATLTLSIGALVTTSGGTLAGSFSGNPIWTGNHTFNGTVSFPGTVIGSTSIINSGIFTSGQMNLYAQSLVNGCSPGDEFHANFGSSHNATEGLNGCITIPTTSTVFQSNAVSGYINNQSGATTGGVAIFGNARVNTTANGRIWGGNFVATGLAGFASNSLYSTENDCNVANTTDVCHGMLVAGNFTAQPVTTDGITISAPGQSGACTTCTWPYGIRFAAAATTTLDLNHAAIVFYPISTASPSQSSQGMTFISYDSGGNNTAAFVSEDSSGNLNMTTTKAGSGVKINSNPLVQEVAAGTVDLTAQTAAITTTTLFAVVNAGEYRLSWNAKVTTAAGTSSTLGALTIVYTDPDGVVQTVTAGGQASGGLFATTNTANTTGTMLLGMPLLLNCKAGTNITYAFAYASNAANAMAYNLHIRLESL